MFKILSILLISFVAGQSYPVSDLGDDQRVEQATEVVLSAASSYSIGDGNSIVSYVWTVNGELKEAILSSDSSLSASASSYID